MLESARHPVSVVLCSDLLYGDGEGAQRAGGAAAALAETLSVICSHDPTTTVLNCYERRFSGDKGAFFFEAMAEKGFEVLERVALLEIDECYSDDDDICLVRMRQSCGNGALFPT